MSEGAGRDEPGTGAAPADVSERPADPPGEAVRAPDAAEASPVVEATAVRAPDAAEASPTVEATAVRAPDAAQVSPTVEATAVRAPDAAQASPAAEATAVRAPDEAAAAAIRRTTARRISARRPAVALGVDDDGWPLEAGEAGPPVEAQPAHVAMPSPAAAAYEAARLVGEMVGDIDSAPGAALVAAAAAGAAIEVARARVAAGEPDGGLPPPAGDAGPGDAFKTVRMQRERILRALAEDVAASATSTATAESAASQDGTARPSSERASSQGGGGPAVRRTESMRIPSLAAGEAASGAVSARDDAGELDDPLDQLDPAAIAAAAIARLRQRARSDLAELRGHYRRHDGLVVVAALVMIVVAGWGHRALVEPPTEPFDPSREHGLSFQRPRGWLTSPAGPLPPPRIARDTAPSPRPPAVYHVELTSALDPTARVEVLVDKKPAWSNIVTGLDLDRRTRWGELYALDDSSVRSVEDHQWLRTAYRFAHAPVRGDVPRVDRAVEYATIDREQLYVVTLFGTPAEIAQLEELVAPTLRVATRSGLPLVPQTGHLASRKFPNAVSRAFASTVMVVVADVVDGRLRARGGGSGVIVGKDGSVLTNYHVVHDRNGRLHDVFVLGRFSAQDQAPQLVCAGRPSRSKLQRELDLALLKCDLDLDGRATSPTAAGALWPPLPQARASDTKIGQRVWVLGYPDVGGGGLTLSTGEVAGWAGGDGSAGKDLLKTDAAIRHGNSGGPVIDDAGRLIGVATAVRARQNADGEIVEVVQAGGRVRPIAAASDLLAIAAAGWTPLEGQTDVELQPSAIEAPSEGVHIQTRVTDQANEAPVSDALVMVLRPGVTAATVDVNRLDDQVLSYGRSNAQGEVSLKQPVPAPGTYAVMVVARGYEPLIADGALTLDASTPDDHNPWGQLALRAR